MYLKTIVLYSFPYIFCENALQAQDSTKILLLQRIQVLVKENKYTDALALGLSFYNGTAKAVIGLSGGLARKQDTVANVVGCIFFVKLSF